MLAQVVQLVAYAVTGTVVIFTLCLIFLLILYFKGGRRDLQAGAEALHKIRDVGVGISYPRRPGTSVKPRCWLVVRACEYSRLR